MILLGLILGMGAVVYIDISYFGRTDTLDKWRELGGDMYEAVKAFVIRQKP